MKILVQFLLVGLCFSLIAANNVIIPAKNKTQIIKVGNQLTSSKGGFLIDFTLDFNDPKKDYVGYMVSCRNWKKPFKGFGFGVNRIKGKYSVWFYPLDINGKAFGFYRNYNFQSNKRYRAELTFINRQCLLKIDGKVVVSTTLKDKVSIYDKIEIGGLGGKYRNVTVHQFKFLELDSKIITLQPSKDTAFDVEVDSTEKLIFSVEHPFKDAQITLRPKNFVFKAKETYYVNCSNNGGPFRVKAVKDGELTFKQSPEVRTTYCITNNLPNLITSAKNIVVEKKTNVDVKKFTIAKVKVKAGKKYRGSFFYNQLAGSTNSAIGLDLVVLADGKRVANVGNRYVYSFPLMPGTKNNPRYCLHEIQVPNKKGNYELILGVELSSDAGKFQITNPEITLAPPKLWHRGKYTKDSFAGDIKKASKIMEKYPVTHATVSMVNGIPRVFFNGKMQTYIPVQAGSIEQVKAAVAEGYRVVMLFVPVNNWGRKAGSVWIAKDQYDWSVLDRKLARIAEVAPQVKIILCCGLAYSGFANDHPEVKWITESGKTNVKFGSTAPNIAYSLSGKTTRIECGKFLYQLGKHLASTPLGKNVVSLHISSGSDGQWYQPERPWNYKKLDYSEATRRAVCEQIQKLYKNNLSALRKAWNMSDATFENLATPTAAELADDSLLLDVKNPKHRRLIEWIKADQLALIESINYFAGQFKAGINKKVLVTTYAPDNRFINKSNLFNASNLDGVVFLSAYNRPRSSGGDGGNAYPIASAALRGKIVLEEVDYRNEYFGYDATNRNGLVALADNDVNYMGQLLRQFGGNWSKGGSGWLRHIQGDSYLAWTGFYQRHLRVIKNAANLALKHQKNENYADIIKFNGEDYQHHMSRKNNFDHMMNYVSTNRFGLTSNGLSHITYILDDLQHPKRAKGKIYVFTGTAAISADKVDYICKNLQKDGNVLIFANDTGRNNSLGFSKTLKKLTGINAKLNENIMVDGIYSNENSVFSDIPKMQVWVRNFSVPQIIVEDKNVEVWAKLPSKLPGVVYKRHKNWSAIYITGTVKNATSPQFWAKVAQIAGITPKTSSINVSYQGNNIRVIHGVKNQEHFVKIKKKLLDLETGKYVKTTNDKATFNLKFGETKLLMEVD